MVQLFMPKCTPVHAKMYSMPLIFVHMSMLVRMISDIVHNLELVTINKFCLFFFLKLVKKDMSKN